MQLVKLEAIGIKSEATQNTAITLTATDFVLAQDVSCKVVQEFVPREYKHLSLDNLAHVVSSVYVDISFKTEVKGSGTAGTAYAPLSAALQACGMSETISAGVSVTYAAVSVPNSASFFTLGKSATIEYYDGATLTKTGLKRVIKGCVGTATKISLEAGKIGMYEFSFRGLYTAATDAVCPSVTYLAALPPIVQNASFTTHAFSAIISKLEIDFGLAVASRPDANSADGIKGFTVVDRNPKGSCDPEGELVATFDLFGKMRSGVSASTSIAVGATAGNITTLTMPATQIAGADPGERSGIRTYSVPLKFNQSTGDDWISIVMT